MHQRLAAGENDPLHFELAKAGQVRLEVALRDLSDLPYPPDIAHHAAAVAAVVREDYQNRKARDPMVVIHAETSLPARRTPSEKDLIVSLSSRRTGARTSRDVPPTRINSIPVRRIVGQPL